MIPLEKQRFKSMPLLPAGCLPRSMSPDQGPQEALGCTAKPMAAPTWLMILLSSILSWASPSFRELILDSESRSEASSAFSLLAVSSSSARLASACERGAGGERSNSQGHCSNLGTGVPTEHGRERRATQQGRTRIEDWISQGCESH